MRYGAGALQWRVDKLKQKSDVDIPYVSRKEVGRGLMSCKRKFTSEENNLAWYLKNFYKNLLQGVKHVGIQREISEIKIFEKFKILKKILKNR